jgi:uncharacterized LabA/DUF88 family protein
MCDQKPPQRVGCYVDGFNLYFGLRDSDLRRFMWLDLAALARHVILPHQVVVFTKLFTARISGGRPTDRPEYAADMDAKRRRQSDYIDALKAHAENLTVHEGHFLSKELECKKCGATWAGAEEKMTDVNIATALIVDAFANRFDTAILVSGDSDLVPPIRAVRQCFPHKRVIVAFPPGRSSVHLVQAASGRFVISNRHLRMSQMPDEVQGPRGVKFTRPPTWS